MPDLENDSRQSIFMLIRSKWGMQALLFTMMLAAFIIPSLLVSVFIIQKLKKDRNEQSAVFSELISTSFEVQIRSEVDYYASLMKLFSENVAESDINLSELALSPLLVYGVIDDTIPQIHYSKHPSAAYLSPQSLVRSNWWKEILDIPKERLLFGVETAIPPPYFRKYIVITGVNNNRTIFGVFDSLPIFNRFGEISKKFSDVFGGIPVLIGQSGDVFYAPDKYRYRFERTQSEKIDEINQVIIGNRKYYTWVTSLRIWAEAIPLVLLRDAKEFDLGLSEVILLLVFCDILIVLLGVIASFSIQRIIALPIIRLSQVFETSARELTEATQEGFELTNLNSRGADKLSKLVHKLPRSSVSEVAILYNGVSSLTKKMVTYENQLIKTTEQAAIARTTHMVAHDVRKPFSMLKLILSDLSGTKDVVKMQRIASQFLPEVERAIASVESMIDDIMEIGASAKLNREVVSFESLLMLSLYEFFRPRPNTVIKISYDMRHHHMMYVDSLKVRRVFSNIIENAIQAMNNTGNLRFKTKEIQIESNDLIEICIGNDGPVIDDEDIKKIFTPFFTKGKEKGTGLGLAVVERMIAAHGGKVWCKSSIQKGTEFNFTLQINSSMPVEDKISLPQHSSEVNEYHSAFSRNVLGNQKEHANITALQNVRNRLEVDGEPLVLLLIDDESIYLDELNAQLKKELKLVSFLRIFNATNSADAFHFAKVKIPHLIICDIDMGKNSLNGHEIIQGIRKADISTFICAHSNMSHPTDREQALTSGANVFLPKPMNLKQLLELLEATLKNKVDMR